MKEILEIIQKKAEIGPFIELFTEMSEMGNKLPGTGIVISLKNVSAAFETFFGTPTRAISSTVVSMMTLGYIASKFGIADDIVADLVEEFVELIAAIVAGVSRGVFQGFGDAAARFGGSGVAKAIRNPKAVVRNLFAIQRGESPT